MIDKLCDQARDEDLAVAWLYCDYNAKEEQTVISIMGAILKGLVGGGEIPKEIREAFWEAENVGGRSLLHSDLRQMLGIVIELLPKLFICIDGLDECLPKNLLELLGSLGDIVREFPSTRIFLTGRPQVKKYIRRSFPKAVTIRINPNRDDIRNYVMMRLDSDIEREAMSDDLRANIVKIILDEMSNMYVGAFPLSMMCTY